MKIDILCSSEAHPVNPWLVEWASRHAPAHRVSLYRRKGELAGGNVLFLVSCSEIIGRQIRDRYDYSFVLHASDLPRGRGWSPHVWAILAGATELTVSLLEAGDKVDTGRIWAKRKVAVPLDTLFDEINTLLFEAEVKLMDDALQLIAAGHVPEAQPDEGATYYPQRHPEDSKIDPDQPLTAFFNLLRVADPERYPAFFHLHGTTYKIRIEKMK